MNKNEIIKGYGTKTFKEFEEWAKGKPIKIRINTNGSSEIDYPKEYVEEFYKKEKKVKSRSNKSV